MTNPTTIFRDWFHQCRVELTAGSAPLLIQIRLRKVRYGRMSPPGRPYWLLDKGFPYMTTGLHYLVKTIRLNGSIIPYNLCFRFIAPAFLHRQTSFHVCQETWTHAIAVLEGPWWNLESLIGLTESWRFGIQSGCTFKKCLKKDDTSYLRQQSSNLEETTCLNFKQNIASVPVAFCQHDVIKPENKNSHSDSNRSMRFTCRAKENLRW